MGKEEYFMGFDRVIDALNAYVGYQVRLPSLSVRQPRLAFDCCVKAQLSSVVERPS
jgi:hypothetical protein